MTQSLSGMPGLGTKRASSELDEARHAYRNAPTKYAALKLLRLLRRRGLAPSRPAPKYDGKPIAQTCRSKPSYRPYHRPNDPNCTCWKPLVPLHPPGHVNCRSILADSGGLMEAFRQAVLDAVKEEFGDQANGRVQTFQDPCEDTTTVDIRVHVPAYYEPLDVEEQPFSSLPLQAAVGFGNTRFKMIEEERVSWRYEISGLEFAMSKRPEEVLVKVITAFRKALEERKAG